VIGMEITSAKLHLQQGSLIIIRHLLPQQLMYVCGLEWPA
jgi:hypothetical protein